jgi:hypothetical protein
MLSTQSTIAYLLVAGIYLLPVTFKELLAFNWQWDEHGGNTFFILPIKWHEKSDNETKPKVQPATTRYVDMHDLTIFCFIHK